MLIHETKLQWNFFQKFILPYFESHFKLCLFKEILSYLQTDATLSANNSQHCCVLFARSSIHTFFWTYQICKQLYSIPSKNECVLSWLTNVAVAGVLIYIKYIYIFLVSTKSPFKLLDPPIKGHVKKNFFKEECVPMFELRKTSLGASLGQMGKQLYAGAMKPEPGFYGSGFGFFQSVRCPFRWIRVTQAGFGDEIHTFSHK